MINVKFNEKSEQDLKEIYQYSYFQYGKTKADYYINDLKQCLNFLAENPLVARERHEFKQPVRIHHHAKHLVIYQQLAENILIIRLLHERVEIKKHL